MGYTTMLNGIKVSKNDCLVQVFGEIDELQTQLDKLLIYLESSVYFQKEIVQLKRIEFLLWQLGGELSFGRPTKIISKPIVDSDVKDLEAWIDDFNLNIQRFQRFTNIVAIEANETRVRTRKIERNLVEYIKTRSLRAVIYRWVNRLSTYFFALAVSIEKKAEEVKETEK